MQMEMKISKEIIAPWGRQRESGDGYELLLLKHSKPAAKKWGAEQIGVSVSMKGPLLPGALS